MEQNLVEPGLAEQLEESAEKLFEEQIEESAPPGSPMPLPYRYSPSTGAFYPIDTHYPNLPDDLIAVSENDYQRAINRPFGAALAVEGGALFVIPPSAAFALERARSQQAAAISAACAAAITGGFQSAALGQAHTYPSKPTDQSNLTGAVTASIMTAGVPGWTINFWCSDADGNWAFVPHTAAQIQGVYADGIAALQAYQARNQALQEQITAATTVEAAQAVAWGEQP